MAFCTSIVYLSLLHNTSLLQTNKGDRNIGAHFLVEPMNCGHKCKRENISTILMNDLLEVTTFQKAVLKIDIEASAGICLLPMTCTNFVHQSINQYIHILWPNFAPFIQWFHFPHFDSSFLLVLRVQNTEHSCMPEGCFNLFRLMQYLWNGNLWNGCTTGNMADTLELTNHWLKEWSTFFMNRDLFHMIARI